MHKRGGMVGIVGMMVLLPAAADAAAAGNRPAPSGVGAPSASAGFGPTVRLLLPESPVAREQRRLLPVVDEDASGGDEGIRVTLHGRRIRMRVPLDLR